MKNLNIDVTKIQACRSGTFLDGLESENWLLKSDSRILIERESKAKNSIYLNGHPYYGYLNGTDVLNWAVPMAQNITHEPIPEPQAPSWQVKNKTIESQKVAETG